MGHSLGGKVVLALQRASGQRVPQRGRPRRVALARPDGLGAEQTRDILTLLGRLPREYRTRAEFVAAAEAGGQPRAIAQWLAMALQPSPGKLILDLDLPGLESLYASVLAEDDWDVVTSVPPGHRLAFVVGGASPTSTPPPANDSPRWLLGSPWRRSPARGTGCTSMRRRRRSPRSSARWPDDRG